jgi:NAD(P)-dependent dehydrogenase (short-subunit alcohol dehydrogenase family)
MTELPGHIVVVTGASKGIGRETAFVLAAQGASIVAVARDRSELDALIPQLAGAGHRVAAMDVRDDAAWAKLVAGLDRIDAVVAAAGIYGPIGRLDTVELSRIRDAFDVNVFGSLLSVRACLPRLAESRGAVVLFGGGGSEPLPGYDAYLASKAAVVRLAENLAAELAEVGIRVNAIAPGFVATDIHLATLAAGPGAAGVDFYARTVKALEEGGFPVSEAANLVAFLISPSSASLTGRFISARWDDWRDPDWRSRLVARPDLLTMRRIDGSLFAPVTVGE